MIFVAYFDELLEVADDFDTVVDVNFDEVSDLTASPSPRAHFEAADEAGASRLRSSTTKKTIVLWIELCIKT